MFAMAKKKGQDKIRYVLKQRVLKDIDGMLSDIFSKSIDSVALRFYSSVQEFFGTYCNVHYKFTVDELLHEISRKKVFDDFITEKVTSLLRRLQDKEYSSTDFSRVELSSFIREYKMIVKTVSTQLQDTAFDPYFSWRRVLHRVSFALSSIRNKVLKDEVSRIVESIPSVEKAIHESRIEDAELLYEKLNFLYDKLSGGEKKNVYSGIHKLYQAIGEAHKNRTLSQLDALEEKFYHSLESNSLEAAKTYYNEIQVHYDGLDKEHRKTLYPELKVMFRKLQDQLQINQRLDVERLLAASMLAVRNNELAAAKYSYDRAKRLYQDLPDKTKKEMYQNIQKAFSQINSAVAL